MDSYVSALVIPNCEQFRESRGKGCLKLHHFPRNRVFENQEKSMQPETIDWIVVRAAVFPVTYDWVSYNLHVNANLVLSSGFKLQFDE